MFWEPEDNLVYTSADNQWVFVSQSKTGSTLLETLILLIGQGICNI